MEVRLTTLEGDEYRPLPIQQAFHQSRARYRSYIGGFGSGKTCAGAVEAIIQSLEYPGKHGQGLVARYEYAELLSTTWKQLAALIPRPIIQDVVLSKPVGPLIRLKNGFSILGRNFKDHEALASLNLAWAWVDECNEEGVDLTTYHQVCGRLRDRLGSRQVWLTGNPAGKNWVWERFFSHEEGGKKWPDHEGFHAKSRENIYLPDDYVNNLRQFYPEEWIEKYLEGRFDIFEGQILDNFRPEIHVVSDFDVPREWPRFRGLDHGLTNPTACIWGASDFEGNLLCYREYYQRNAIPAENARAILMASGDEVFDWTVIDPSTMQTQSAGGTAEKIIDQYGQAGLYCQLGNNAVRDSIARLKQMLQPDPSHKFPRWHPRAGELGAPWLYVADSLKALRWEISVWKWKDARGTNEREKVLEKNDHAIAALRYLVMRSPRPAVETIQPTTYQRFLDIVREMKGEPEIEDGFDLMDVNGNQGCRFPYARSAFD